MVMKPRQCNAVLQGIIGEDERDGEVVECSKRVEGLVGDRIQGQWGRGVER